MEIFHEPKFWIAAAFVLFIALSYKKISVFLTNALDDRSAKIKSELDQARHLRMEAENVLADYKQKQSEYLKEAEIMLQKARTDADDLTANSEKELKTALDLRMKNAIERIAQEEEKAIQDVRNHVVDIALAAARAIILEQAGTSSGEDLVKIAMADIERKIH